MNEFQIARKKVFWDAILHTGAVAKCMFEFLLYDGAFKTHHSLTIKVSDTLIENETHNAKEIKL